MDNVEITRVDYREGPLRVRIGWAVMLIGCIMFFISATMEFIVFGAGIATPKYAGDSESLVELIRLLIVALLMTFAGIGGICFLVDRSRLKTIGTLAAVIVLVVFVIDTVLTIRTLIHDLAGRSINPVTGDPYSASQAWLRFALGLLDMQLSGGVYLIGWAILKDYVGDEYERVTKKN